MKKEQQIQWVLRIGIAGEFLGHGVLALQGKAQWVGWMQQLIGIDQSLATQMLFLIGSLDVLVALLVLVKPMKPVLLWAAFWGFATALLRPIVGEPIWDFIERFANWATPLSLYLLMNKGKKSK